MARFLLAGKIANARTVLQRVLRDHGDKIAQGEVEAAVAQLGGALRRLEKTDSLGCPERLWKEKRPAAISASSITS